MRKSVSLPACIFIAGCASNVYYYNPYIDSDSQRAMQLEIDDGYCTSVSFGAVPMPEVRHYDSGTRTYTFNASIYQLGMPTSNLTGFGSVSPSPSDAFSSGFANGASIGSALRASADRETVYNGCMTSLGWTTSKEIADAIYTERANSKPSNINDSADNSNATGDPVIRAINKTAYLKKWYHEKSQKFEYAVLMDEKLKADPIWKNQPLEKRFAEATRLTRIHFGEIIQ